MPPLYYVQNCIMGLAILGLILITRFQLATPTRYPERVINAAIFVNAALLILEMIGLLATGHTSAFARIILTPLGAVFYTLNPVPAALWVLYIISLIQKKRPSRIIVITISMPVLLNAVLTCTSVFTHLIFYLDPSNNFHRGPLVLLMFGTTYSYILLSTVYLVKKRKALTRSQFPPLFFFVIPAFAAGILQIFFFGLSVTWEALAFSLLYLHLQTKIMQISTDHLTGLANKREFDNRLSILFENRKRKYDIGGIMIDVDNFKTVNDQYGHETGDEILKSLGEILQKSVRNKHDLAARVGGDEFAVLVTMKKQNSLSVIINLIQINVKQFNERSSYPFSLSISMGYSVLTHSENISAEQFFKRIDQKMYEDKQAHKRLNKSIHTS